MFKLFALKISVVSGGSTQLYSRYMAVRIRTQSTRMVTFVRIWRREITARLGTDRIWYRQFCAGNHGSSDPDPGRPLALSTQA